jgi:hypothetical protein
MTGPFHTYGTSCLLADEELDLSSLYSLPRPPEVRSQFFYISSLPIDDPLAPLPPATGQSDGNQRDPPKPFSARDNLALETAWRELGNARQTKAASNSPSRPETSQGRSGIAVPGHGPTLELQRRRKAANLEGASLGSSRGTPTSFPDDLPRNLNSRSGYLASRSDARAEDYADRHAPTSSMDNSFKEGNYRSSIGIAYRKRERSSSLNESPSTKRRNSIEDDPPERQDEAGLRATASRDASISGSPFIRAPISQSHSPLSHSVESLSSKDGAQEGQVEGRSRPPSRIAPKPSNLRTSVSLDELTQDSSRDETNPEDSQIKIPVGASRLHLVELPNLKVCTFSCSKTLLG